MMIPWFTSIDMSVIWVLCILQGVFFQHPWNCDRLIRKLASKVKISDPFSILGIDLHVVDKEWNGLNNKLNHYGPRAHCDGYRFSNMAQSVVPSCTPTSLFQSGGWVLIRATAVTALKTGNGSLILVTPKRIFRTAVNFKILPLTNPPPRSEEAQAAIGIAFCGRERRHAASAEFSVHGQHPLSAYAWVTWTGFQQVLLILVWLLQLTLFRAEKSCLY